MQVQRKASDSNIHAAANRTLSPTPEERAIESSQKNNRKGNSNIRASLDDDGDSLRISAEYENAKPIVDQRKKKKKVKKSRKLQEDRYDADMDLDLDLDLYLGLGDNTNVRGSDLSQIKEEEEPAGKTIDQP
jgi:hypothetical protein